MPIQVTCPGCHQRFKVSDKFAGQQGPCPKCKTPMKIPTLEEQVVIHAPEDFGPKNAEGRSVLRPIERRETKISPVQWAAIGGTVVLIPALAFLVGMMFRDGGETNVPPLVLAIGALLVAPPLTWAGYSFLRNDELEPYTGSPLYIRLAICSVSYAVLWGGYALLKQFWFGGAAPEVWQLLFAVPVLFIPGTLASLATLDLDGTNAALHYGMYFGATIILRVIMGMPAF
jgi:hypothetical protein